MLVDNENEDSVEKAMKSQKEIDKLMDKISDFSILASTLKSEAPVRDAYKIVFGIDKPEFDPNTPEGMRTIKRMNAFMGISKRTLGKQDE